MPSLGSEDLLTSRSALSHLFPYHSNAFIFVSHVTVILVVVVFLPERYTQQSLFYCSWDNVHLQFKLAILRLNADISSIFLILRRVPSSCFSIAPSAPALSSLFPEWREQVAFFNAILPLLLMRWKCFLRYSDVWPFLSAVSFERYFNSPMQSISTIQVPGVHFLPFLILRLFDSLGMACDGCALLAFLSIRRLLPSSL